MNQQRTFTDVLRAHVEASQYSAGQLSKLTGLPKETIANWLDGVVRKPRNWRDLAKLAVALHLTENEASALLQAAGRPPIAELLAQAEDAADRALLAPWNSAAHQLQAALRQLECMPLDGVPEPAALPPGSRMLLRRNSRFVGRADLLRGGGTVVIDQASVAAATGLGGIGKTQLAAEFVHRYGQFFAGGVFWLSFADPNDLPNEVAACGGTGFMDVRPDFADLTVEQQVQAVRAAWHSPLPRLLVFDNCEEETLLDTWQPTTGGCRILITSRRTQWDSALDVQTLPLDVLQRAGSMALLRSHRPDLDAADPASPTTGMLRRCWRGRRCSRTARRSRAICCWRRLTMSICSRRQPNARRRWRGCWSLACWKPTTQTITACTACWPLLWNNSWYTRRPGMLWNTRCS